MSPIILAQPKMTWTFTQLEHVIVAENLTAYASYEFRRHTGENYVILLSENVNWMMFRNPLLNGNGQETFLRNQEFSGPRVIR